MLLGVWLRENGMCNNPRRDKELLAINKCPTSIKGLKNNFFDRTVLIHSVEVLEYVHPLMPPTDSSNSSKSTPCFWKSACTLRPASIWRSFVNPPGLVLSYC